MADRKELAVEIKHTGVNCAQAVLLAFKEESGLSEDTLKKLGSAFGGGMGCMEATCGALCGAEMILGLVNKDGHPVRQDAAVLLKSFTDKCGSSICGEIKGRDTGVVLCSCDDCVRNAAMLLEERLKDEEHPV